MYQIHKDTRVYLLDRNNYYVEYKSYTEFIEKVAKPAFYRRQRTRESLLVFLGEIHGVVNDVGNNWNDTYQTCEDKTWKTVRHNVDYILYDASFRVIHTEKIKKDVDNYVPKCYNSDIPYRQREGYFKKHEWLGFRNGPVPYTGGGKWRFTNFYRMPRTTQEKRISCEHNKYVRAKRNHIHLPNSWDDKPRSNWNQKCWKDCTKKRKQWIY